jgi:hypothetical protein
MMLLLLACTTAQGEERFNVHEALRQGNEEACALCHTEGEELRIDAHRVCDGCHQDATHAGIAEHVGVPLSPDMKRAAEQAKLPLREGAATCLSCHDPHPAGSVPHRPEMHPSKPAPDWWPGPRGVTSTDQLRLPVDDLCVACHDQGPGR